MNAVGCKKCRGTGWIVQEADGIEGVTTCPECRQPQRAARLLKRAGIPPRYFGKSLDSYHPLDGKTQQEAARKAVDYIDAYPDVSRGLLFVGTCGVGKTHLSVAILRSLIEEQLISGRFVDETELLRRLHYSYGPDSRDTEQQLLKPLMDADLLVWDDLGSSRGTDWARETIGMVLNYRYTYSRLTILSTNRALDGGQTSRGSSQRKLSEQIGTRLYSRIMEMCEVVGIRGPDFRSVVHKAGHDFQAQHATAPPAAPAADSTPQMTCPKCGSDRLDQLDEATRDGRKEVFCRCADCDEQFTSRLAPGAEVEYVLLEDG